MEEAIAWMMAMVDRRHAAVEYGGEVEWEEKMEKSHH